MNKVYYLKILQPALDLSRVVFITSSFTASASESVINGLLPHMEVIRVGTPTRGKPVGMNAFAIPRQVLELSAARWVLFPICFETRNRLHQGAYYDGLLPDISVQDDVLHLSAIRKPASGQHWIISKRGRSLLQCLQIHPR
jgi:hypothetical protein